MRGAGPHLCAKCGKTRPQSALLRSQGAAVLLVRQWVCSGMDRETMGMQTSSSLWACAASPCTETHTSAEVASVSHGSRRSCRP